MTCHNTRIRSRAGVLKPVSPPQLLALAAVRRGEVYFRPHSGRVFGCRNDTYEVLERNALVEVLEEPENPASSAIARCHAVRLTDAGRAMVETSRS